MKKTMKVLSLVMALVLLCFVFASCAKTLSGTYSAEVDVAVAGVKTSLTFSGKKVTFTTTTSILGSTTTTETKGTYSITEAADGTQSITIEYESDADDEAEKIGGTHSFSEGKDENGNKTITIGLITYTQAK